MKHNLILTVIIYFAFASCKKEPKYSAHPPYPGVYAYAGSDTVIIVPADSAVLDGSKSFGNITGYAWKQVAGPSTAYISNSSAVTTIATKLIAGIYKFELQVKGYGISSEDTLQVSVYDRSTNRPPIANAGPDQKISLPTNSVNLDGSNSSDPDNNIKTFYWRILSSNTFYTNVPPTVPKIQARNLQNGLHLFELTVTDFFGLVSKDTVKVTVDPFSCVSGRPMINALLIPVGKLSQARGTMAVASAGNKIVFAGGPSNNFPFSTFTRVDIYDFVTNTWTTAELSKARGSIAAVSNGNKIFFAGGGYYDYNNDESVAVSTVDIYDAVSNSWSVTSLSEPRFNISAAAVGNKVFFAGGINEIMGFRKTVDIYDLTTNSWSVSQLSEARGSISAVTINNKIYFAGGQQYAGDPSSKIDIYDNATNVWSTSSLLQSMYNMAAVATGNKIYWAGGVQNSSGNPVCNVEIKDVNSQSSATASLFIPGVWNPVYGTNAVLKNNKIVFLRLQYGNYGTDYSDKFDIYDINTNTWSVGVLPQLISGASLISVNNIVYIAGGNVDGVVSDQVWKLEF